MAEDDELGRYLEKRAEDLGLPTEPGAYQDGGLAAAVTADNLAEADVMASLLRANEIPAWVNAPHATQVGGAPPMYSVLVPLGRLADAQRLIAEHPHQQPPPEEAEAPAGEPAQEQPDAAHEAADETPGEPLAPAPALSGLRLAAALIILVVGFGGLAYVVTAVSSACDLAPHEWVPVAIWGVLSVAACAVGILVLGSRSKSDA